MVTISSYLGPLDKNTFSSVQEFLSPKELALSAENVSKSWNQFIHTTAQWKKHCQFRLNIPPNIDPKSFLPSDYTYKKGALLASPKVFDGRSYSCYLPVKIGPVPPISEVTSFGRRDELDPCDTFWQKMSKPEVLQEMIRVGGFQQGSETDIADLAAKELLDQKTIGQSYAWIYVPPYYEITDKDFPFVLDKLDDPNDEEAPKLIPKQDVKHEGILKVPNTLNNVEILFKYPKYGNSSAISYGDSSRYLSAENQIPTQQGNKRIPFRWVCMRENPFGNGGISADFQLIMMCATGVAMSGLLPRVLFNFLIHVSSAKKNFYPDVQPWNLARTSTKVIDNDGFESFTGCGSKRANTDCLHADQFYLEDAEERAGGTAVVLPGSLPQSIEEVISNI